MKAKDLKEMLSKISDDTEVLIAEYMDCCGSITIRSYDEPSVDTFSMQDGKLLIKGYTDKTAYDYKRRVINSKEVEMNSKSLSVGD